MNKQTGNLPDRAKLYPYSNGDKFRGKSHTDIFNEIEENNVWLEKETVSGIGSSIMQTKELISKLPLVLNTYKIRSIFDIPCGDFNWFDKIDLTKYSYLGGDIVKKIIERNNIKHNSSNLRFIHFNLIEDNIPAFDLIFCRDCLVHFSFEDIYKALENIQKSQSTLLMTTTFPDEATNVDVPTGGWRPLNLEAPPFNFKSPEYLLNEGCTEMDGVFKDKSLGLWRIEDIKL